MTKKDLDEIRSETSEDRAVASAALSTQARTIALGVLALVWLLVGGTQQSLVARFACFTTPLLWIAFICVIALLLDFLQYVFNFFESDVALKASWKANRAEDAGYDEGNLLRRLSLSCFFLKLITTAVAAFWMLSIIFAALV